MMKSRRVIKRMEDSNMSTIKIEPVIITEREAELDMLACMAHGIDETKYPEMSDIINHFLVLETFNQDYLNLADELIEADKGKIMPKEIVKLVIRIYEYEVEEKNALAANNLACLYYSGRIDGKEDYKNARKYYEIADKLGYSLATENLAYIFFYGFETEIDYAMAYKYFSKAALCGRYEAMYKLGDMFRYGYFVEKDENMAAKCYFESQELIKQDSMAFIKCYGGLYHRIADCYCEGIGVQKDLKTALHYYQLAETGYYEQIEAGDKYHMNQIKVVVECQKKIRKRLQKALPEYIY